MSSRVADIVTNFVTTLQAINGSSPYSMTIKNSFQVDDLDSNFGELPEDSFPHFSVLLAEQERAMEPSYVNQLLNFQIACTFKHETTSNISNWMADIETALAQDVTRGGRAIETWVQKITRDNIDEEDYRIFVMDVFVRHTYPFGSPNSP